MKHALTQQQPTPDAEAAWPTARHVLGEVLNHANARLTAECIALISGLIYSTISILGGVRVGSNSSIDFQTEELRRLRADQKTGTQGAAGAIRRPAFVRP